MIYYIDTEFLEGPQKEKFPISLFRKETKPTIDLISIGIVAEDGREYYAISKDFNLKEAWNRYDLVDAYDVNGDLVKNIQKVFWIRENVLKPIYYELYSRSENDGFVYSEWHIFKKGFSFKSLKKLINKYGKTNKQIAEEIKEFCNDEIIVTNIDGKLVAHSDAVRGNPEFYGYYSDYGWVAFCWLFGKMIDLPKGFPMYCFDLKQLMDEKALIYDDDQYSNLDIAGKIEYLKTNSNYPKQENEHSAIHDARWNKKLHEFLNQL